MHSDTTSIKVFEIKKINFLFVTNRSYNHFRFTHQSLLLWLQQRHLVAKPGETVRKMATEFCLSVSLVYLRGPLICPKNYDMGPTASLPLRRQSSYRFLSPLKINRAGLGLNQGTLGPIASTTTITQHRMTIYDLISVRALHFKAIIL
jgi:hypothetical protein